MPVPASRAGSIKQLSEHQRSAAASPTPSGAADKQSSKRQTASKTSKSIPTTVFPDADNLPSTYAASTNTTAAAGGPRPGPSTQQQQQQEAADAALYRDMRSALAEFESQQRKLSCTHASTAAAGQSNRPARMPPRQTAFYAALRSVLQQVLAETTPAGRHTRLLAAHAWYVGHRPRPVAADPGLAAAMAASLSIGTPGQQQRLGSPQNRGNCSRPHSPGMGAGELGWDSDSCCSDSETADAACLDQRQSSFTAAAAAATAAGTVRPSSAVHAHRLDAAARSAFVSSWPYGGSNGGSSGGRGGSSGAADVPGLIPVGALPSSRFTSCFPHSRPTLAAAPAAPAAARTSVAAATAAAAAGTLPGSRKSSTVSFRKPHEEEQQQQQQQQYVGKSAWSAVMTQQAALESEVADSMRGFARQRARIEEDISRRQELAAVAAAATAAGRRAPAAAAAAAAGSSGCVLQHMDSQHQPSQVTAELVLTAGGKLAGRLLAGNAPGSNGGSSGSSGVQLVVPDRVKAARKQHQQEGAQEVSALQESMGLPDSVLARALLPPPDVPYMSAFAQLPKYSPPAKAAAAKKKKKKKGGKGQASRISSRACSDPVRLAVIWWGPGMMSF